MHLKQYPQLVGLKKTGFSVDEIERGIHVLWMDVTCPWCGTEQAVTQTGYLGGPCCRCGKRTDGSVDL